ncbi:MAG TPA: ATP-binding protein [Methylophilus sp.]
MQLESLPSLDRWMTASRRRNLKLLNVYRLIVASTLLLSQLALINGGFSSLQPLLTTKILIVYFTISLTTFVLSWPKRAEFELSVPVQIIIDIGFILLLRHFFDVNQASVGLLLIITIVFAGLVSEARYALFYASIASIGLLLEETYNIFLGRATSEGYTDAALLSISCFATAWLAYTLASRMQSSERLAAERAVDITNLAKINALITQEMPNGVLVVGDHQQLKHYNQQFTALTGLSDEVLTQAINEDVALAHVIPELAVLLDDWAAQSSADKQTEATKLTIANRDLGIRFLSTTNPSTTGAVIFVEDWSQIQTQAHQVKLAALGRLTANIAHEIRNPLSAISHANQLLQEDSTDPATLRMLTIIADNVQRLDQIIKDVLELNRRDRTNQESLLLYPFISEFHHQFCAVEKINPADFSLRLSKQEQTIYFDRRHINQILWNLCKNGWRHSQQKHGSLVLSVKTSAASPFMTIEIADDGTGIASAIQAHLFEPFNTSEKTGTGLGLYIAKELAEANGAKLSYKTAKTGTQFMLYVKKG